MEPLYKLLYNAGVVLRLAFRRRANPGGRGTAAGQFAALRFARSATNSAALPVTVFAHVLGVPGIEVDPTRPRRSCTYSRAVGETAAFYHLVCSWDAGR